jgi:hypothetical protein
LSLLDEIVERLERATPEQRAEIARQTEKALGGKPWYPTPGPQLDAYESPADVLLYGGMAGGGKTALLTGLALCEHRRSLLMRRQYSDLGAMIEDTLKQYGTRDGFNGSPPARLRSRDGRLIEFGAAKLPGDEEHWKGQAHDFLGLDEVSQFLESQVRFLMGWVRSDVPGQRCRVVLATNPPDNPADGQWLLDMFAPWLNDAYDNPAKPGELRWVVSDEDGKDRWVDGPDPIMIGGRQVIPESRTFIPARLEDNPFLKDTGYASKLDALPEPLRSAVRDGNWMIAHEDDQWQLLPTNWILQAQQRWRPDPPNVPMCAMGVDVALGGSANTVIQCRYDTWFAEPIVVPGRDTPLGSDVAAAIIKHRRHNAAIEIDVGGGYGSGAYEHLKANGLPVHGFKGAERATGRTADGLLGFVNLRAQAGWRLREALDPDQPGGSPIAIPPDRELFSELVAQRYEPTPRGLKLVDKEDIAKELGRSPDRADAVMMAWHAGPTYATHGQVWKKAIQTSNRPERISGHEAQRRR